MDGWPRPIAEEELTEKRTFSSIAPSQDVTDQIARHRYQLSSPKARILHWEAEEYGLRGGFVGNHCQSLSLSFTQDRRVLTPASTLLDDETTVPTHFVKGIRQNWISQRKWIDTWNVCHEDGPGHLGPQYIESLDPPPPSSQRIVGRRPSCGRFAPETSTGKLSRASLGFQGPAAVRWFANAGRILGSITESSTNRREDRHQGDWQGTPVRGSRDCAGGGVDDGRGEMPCRTLDQRPQRTTRMLQCIQSPSTEGHRLVGAPRRPLACRSVRRPRPNYPLFLDLLFSVGARYVPLWRLRAC